MLESLSGVSVCDNRGCTPRIFRQAMGPVWQVYSENQGWTSSRLTPELPLQRTGDLSTQRQIFYPFSWRGVWIRMWGQTNQPWWLLTWKQAYNFLTPHGVFKSCISNKWRPTRHCSLSMNVFIRLPYWVLDVTDTWSIWNWLLTAASNFDLSEVSWWWSAMSAAETRHCNEICLLGHDVV